MKVIRGSNLEEYANLFWKRQKAKRTDNDRKALDDFDAGVNSVGWLVNLYPYKLPQLYNNEIQLVKIEASTEVDRFLIHHYMITDAWMVERCLVRCPKSRRLGDLAATSLESGYFDTGRPDTQIEVFNKWKERSSIEGLIEEYGYPLVEMSWPNEYEIVDGWGRLHAISALLKKGLSFQPFDCFVATRKDNGISP